MDFSFSEEQTLLRNTIQSFIQDNYDFDKRKEIIQSEYGKESLRYSLLIFASLKIWCAFHYYMAGKYLKDDLVIN